MCLIIVGDDFKLFNKNKFKAEQQNSCILMNSIRK